MAKTKTETLSLSLKAVRTLQTKHGIKNLLNMGEDVANVSPDFLADIYFEGSRKWENPPTLEQIENMTLSELIDALQSMLAGDTAGKPATA